MELEVLKAIETELPANIPITSFFDLIVGTRFVYEVFHFRPCSAERGFYHSINAFDFV